MNVSGRFRLFLCFFRLLRGAEERHLGVDDELVRREFRGEVEGSLRAGGDDVAEKNKVSRAVVGIDRHAGDERMRDIGLK